MTDSDQLYHKFTEVESQLKLFEFEWNGIPVWEIARYEFFQALACSTGVWASFQGSKSRSRSTARKTKLSTVRYAHKWFFPWRRCDVLICGHPRRKPNGDGRWIDIYTDPVREELEHHGVRVEHVEPAFGSGRTAHFRPPYSEPVRYLEVADGLSWLLRCVPRAPPRDFVKRLDEAERRFKSEFEQSLSVTSYMWTALRGFKTQRAIWRCVFKLTRPKLFLFPVLNGKEALVAAARDVGVTSAELQHGSPSGQKVNSDYDREIRPRRFATDWYLAFGKYWIDKKQWPISNHRVLDFGFPYMARKRSELNVEGVRDCVLFVSQPSIGRFLSALAVEYARTIAEPKRRIVYKLHPGEVTSWKEQYPWLCDSDVEVIDDEKESMYDLFLQACVQVGVYSTALYEGLALNCPLVIVNTSGAEFMDDLVKNGWAVYCNDGSDIEEAIESAPRPGSMGEYFFSSKWRIRLQDILGEAGIEARAE